MNRLPRASRLTSRSEVRTSTRRADLAVSTDPFGTAWLRERVLAGWAAAPVRFREDANAEEDQALGGYRDRLIVELAQNAADAAVRAGVAGRLWLTLRELDGQAVLVAANTGAPLDADGVQALCTLRASSKRSGEPGGPGHAGQGGGAADGQHVVDLGEVGRFGVGFAAVLAVCDEPSVVSRTGGVRFSAGDTRALIEQAAEHAPELGAELARREGHVPVLRLPFATEGSPPAGFDTAVVLPLRDPAAEDAVRAQLAEVGDPLLLALPGLVEVVVEDRVHAEVDRRWHVLRRTGVHRPELLADRPTEERARRAWQLTWALPRTDPVTGRPMAEVPQVLYAPTASDEPLPWPALLIGSFPMEPGRRHLAAGAASSALIAQAALGYTDLLAERAADGQDVLPLVPTGLAAGPLDGALRAEVSQLLPHAHLLPAAEDPAVLVRPADAVVIAGPAGRDPDVIAALAPMVAGLILAPRDRAAELRALGVEQLPLAEVIESLPAHADLDRWRALYRALAPLIDDATVREGLADLPVPLADGRVVRGPRGALLLTGAAGVSAEQLRRLSLRVVHPELADPLLERLGAVAATPRAVLELPQVRAAVANSPTEDDPLELAEAVLTLVAAAVAAGGLPADAGPTGELSWLADLALPDAEGEPTPASALALPDSPIAAVLDPAEIGEVSSDLVQRWGAPVLRAVGVLADLAVLRVSDLPLDPALDLPGRSGEWPSADDPIELDGWLDWRDEVLDLIAAGDDQVQPVDAVAVEFAAIRDLDAVRPDAWPAAVRLLAADPAARAAVLEPVRVALGGRSFEVEPYSAWWLRHSVRWGQPEPIGLFADPHADRTTAGLLLPAPPQLAALDRPLRRALGCVGALAEIGPLSVGALLDRLADPEVAIGPGALLAVWRRLAELAADGARAEPPTAVRVLAPAGTVLVPVEDVVVVSSPMLRQRADLGHPVLAPARLAAGLADLLDVPLAAEEVAGEVDESGPWAGQSAPVPDGATALLPAAPDQWCEHEQLRVDGVEVDWWIDDRLHAATGEGLAAALAWHAGQWQLRRALAEVLVDPGALLDVLADEAF